MKNKIQPVKWIILFLILIILQFNCKKNVENKHSHDEQNHLEDKSHVHDDDTHDRDIHEDGEKKAIVKSDEHKGIILLPIAIKNIGVISIKAKKIEADRYLYKIPVSSLIYNEDKISILFRRNEWYNKTDIKIIKINKTHALIYTKEILSSDKITITGTALLYLAFIESFGASGHGHVH